VSVIFVDPVSLFTVLFLLYKVSTLAFVKIPNERQIQAKECNINFHPSSNSKFTEWSKKTNYGIIKESDTPDCMIM